MATNQKTITVQAGNSTATTTTKLNDQLPDVPCPDPAGYKYVGARYAPLFADPIQWDETKQTTYEPLTIVLYKGNSYTSKQYVPIGIDINNEEFWAETGNYNAQIEQYRKEVLKYKKQVEENSQEINELKKPAKNNYGFAISLSSPFNTEESVKTRIDNAYSAGANSISICCYLGSTSVDTQSSLVNYAIEYCGTLGLTYSLKFHGYTTDPNAYLQAISSFLTTISYTGIVFVYNEPKKTYLETNSEIMKSTITSLKNRGLTVGVSFNKETLMYGSEVYNEADIVGINMYPSMGYSLTYSVETMMKTLANEFTKLTANVNKPIWVTETGILPYKCFLFNPALYTLNEGYPPNSQQGRTIDYNVPTSYYRAAIKALCGSCNNLILWYTETSLTAENAPYVRSA